jgi:HD-like signal output (HDOD) protein
MAGHAWWGATQWAAYLVHQEQPIKAASKTALRELEIAGGEALSAQAYAGLMLDDPMLALRLIKAANERLPLRMARDITTPLGVVLALGTDALRRQIESAPEVSSENSGFMACEARHALAARIASAWGALHYDMDASELAMAALLANAGEVELWAIAPELPQRALDELTSGRAERSEAAQRQACGFAFLDITLLLIDAWNLPQLIRQLIRGDEGQRARLARLAVNTARHLSNGADDPALPDDMREAAKLTGATLGQVVSALPDIGADEKAELLRQVEPGLPEMPSAEPC